VADRFMAELSRGRRRRPEPLPTPFSPMVEAIIGRRQVLVSTDDASRRALRAVGKVAATTGDVIHLARTPRPDARTTEVVAHELTHVAHPSPAPRFFDDHDRGPEERRAEAVGKLMARAPLSPNSPTSRPAGDRRSDAGTSAATVRRSPARAGGGGTHGTVSATALAAQITGASPPDRATGASAPTVRRRAAGSMRDHVDTPAPTSFSVTSPEEGGGTDGLDRFIESEEGREWFRQQLLDHMDLVVRSLEDHVIVELERRGGRSWRGL
jgi:hypothetical protein